MKIQQCPFCRQHFLNKWGKIIMLNFLLQPYWYFFIPYAMMYLILTLITICFLLEWLIELLHRVNCADCMNERNISNSSETENAEENRRREQSPKNIDFSELPLSYENVMKHRPNIEFDPPP